MITFDQLKIFKHRNAGIGIPILVFDNRMQICVSKYDRIVFKIVWKANYLLNSLLLQMVEGGGSFIEIP